VSGTTRTFSTAQASVSFIPARMEMLGMHFSPSSRLSSKVSTLPSPFFQLTLTYLYLLEDPDAPKLSAVKMHELFSEEYDALTDEEKEALVEEHREMKTKHLKIRRPTTRGKVQDVSNTIHNMKKLVRFLLLIWRPPY
jgi:hypothetical protein